MSAKQPLERQGSAAGGIGGSISGGNSSQSPSLSVCALAVHDEWQVWQFVERYFRAQLPLRDVAWRTPVANGAGSSTTLVTISTLPIQVLEAGHALFRNLDPVKSAYRAPYAHLNLVVCESAEAYKASVKGKVKAWVDERDARGEEWLLVYVPVGTQNNTRETYAKLYGKLAADFCLKAAGDRSAMLSILEGGVQGSFLAAGGAATGGVPVPPPDLPLQPTTQSHQEQWGDVLGKVKAAVGNSFIARARRFQEEVRALEEEAGRQQLRGQQMAKEGAGARAAAESAACFFRLFFAKESLALMSEQLQLPADALGHYQELSALAARWQHLLPAPRAPPRALMVFQRSRLGVPVLEFPVFEFRLKLESPAGTDDGAGGGKPQAPDSGVGLLEVQQYLFAREAALLLQLGRYPDLLRRTQAFVLAHAQALAQLLPAFGLGECAQLWGLLAAWTVLRAWEDFVRSQQQQQQAAASPPPLPAGADAPAPALSKTGRGSVTSSASASSLLGAGAGGKIILLDQGVMARHLAELLDFARLRLLDLARARLGAERLDRESVVCAARREAAGGGEPAATEGETEGSGASAPAPAPVAKRTPPCTTLEEAERAALAQQQAAGVESSSSSSSLDGSSRGGGGALAALPALDDPRHVALKPAALQAGGPWLAGVLASVRALDEHYLRVTEVLARYLDRAGRERCLGRVQAERAAVLLRLGEVEEARRALKALADGCYRRDFWVPLLSDVLRKLARCERERGSARAYVAALLQVLSLQEALDEPAGRFYLAQLDEYVRHPTLVGAGAAGPRLVKPLGLLVMARIRAAPRELEAVPRVELGQPAAVTVWLNLTLRQPLRVDGLTLVLADVLQQRKRKRLGADMGWLTPPPPPPAEGADASPRSPRASSGSTASASIVSPRSPRGSTPRSPRGGAAEEPLEGEKEYLQWRVEGPLVLEPGVNELRLATRALPPPGTYVYERLLLRLGGLVLEQDQLAALDGDTLDLVTKGRPPPRRFSALAKAPARRAVALTVVARPPASSLSLLASPVLPPDPQHVHRLSLLLETCSDTLSNPTLTLVQRPQPALALEGPATLAFYPEGKGGADDEGDGDGDGDGRASPVEEAQAEVVWDGEATATVTLPAEIPPHTILIITMPTRPLPRVVEAFVRGRQDHQLAVGVDATLSAEFNKDLLATTTTTTAGFGAEEGEEEAAGAAAAAAPGGTAKPPQRLAATTGRWSHEALDDGLRRSALTASAEAVILQPFCVTISVQGCSHWRASRRYFVQALLRSRAPLPVTLHDCRLKLPSSYRIVADGKDGGGGSAADMATDTAAAAAGAGVAAYLRDVPLEPGQDVRYTYLIERLAAEPGGAGAGAGGRVTPTGRELPSKMSVSAAYTWAPLRAMRAARVRRHHPPQQQQSFERYFQDSAMLNRGWDTLRTFVVRAQLVPAAETEASGSEPGPGRAPSSSMGALPASAPATPGDVEERGVVVGHFQNRVTEGRVGVALRMDLEARLTEEACREAAARDGSGGGGGRRLRLHFEVAADPADWAVAGVAKGTLEVPPDPATPVRVSCKLVPVRTGLLACPALLFDPVDVRQAVSPKSKRKSNVRWVGPRDIQILACGGLARIPTVRIV